VAGTYIYELNGIAVVLGNDSKGNVMRTISHDALKASYHVAKEVEAGNLSIRRGVDILTNRHGISRSSGEDYIRNYAHLVRGERFTRTINTFAAEYFLTKISEDGGASALSNALQSLRRHIDYYDGLGNGRLRKLQAIHEKFRKLLDAGQVRATREPRYFLQYWLFRQLDTELACKAPLVHSGSNQFDRVLPGDVVWIVSVRQKGEMRLVGPILVDRVVDQQEAIRRFGSSVWNASYHIIARDGTETQIREKSLKEIASQLRFISPSGRDRLTVINGRVDGKELQRLRRLTTNSADLLHSIWSDDYGELLTTDLSTAFENAVQSGAGFGDPVRNRMIETAAVNAVTKDYEQRGWRVKSVEREKCGFDLRCVKGSSEAHVEVKGIQGHDLSFILTRREYRCAEVDQHFVLYIVTTALTTNPRLHSFQGLDVLRRFRFEALAYRAALRDDNVHK
jgi:hypothetical protein